MALKLRDHFALHAWMPPSSSDPRGNCRTYVRSADGDWKRLQKGHFRFWNVNNEVCAEAKIANAAIIT